ncbi:hypothetical protein EBAPG3_008940 [Nitrosospira lacus]|uniref:Uncharacterized protein n=1 Tax=Nitrosospira lacus TaxID=1288494 RepID=A0A1W6SQ37_9PROT|nr:hypothetical protein EBAPG3_008940 [Nitrosospira lacus]
MFHVSHAVKPMFMMLGIIRRDRAVIRYRFDFQVDVSDLHDPGLLFVVSIKIKNSKDPDRYKEGTGAFSRKLPIMLIEIY